MKSIYHVVEALWEHGASIMWYMQGVKEKHDSIVQARAALQRSTGAARTHGTAHLATLPPPLRSY